VGASVAVTDATLVVVTDAMSDTSAAAVRSLTDPTAITTIPTRTVVVAITTGALSRRVAPIGGTDTTLALAINAAYRVRVREGLLVPRAQLMAAAPGIMINLERRLDSAPV
jgi:hypothetical protein